MQRYLIAGERPYPCDLCEREFARKAALRIHKVSVHTNLKSYLCADCGAAFKANSALIDHKKRVHLQIKSHRCNFCGKDFFSKKDFGEHQRTHTGEKPYQCQLCGKCFGRGYHLKRHTDGVHRLPSGSLVASVESGAGQQLHLAPPRSPALTIDPAQLGPPHTKKTGRKVRGRQAGGRSSAVLTTATIPIAQAYLEHQQQPVTSFSISLGEEGEESRQSGQDVKPLVAQLEEKPFCEIKLYDGRLPLNLAQRQADPHLLQRTDQPADLEIVTRDPPAASASPVSEEHFTTYTVAAAPTYIVGSFYRSEQEDFPQQERK